MRMAKGGNDLLVDNIRKLCDEKGITIYRLEHDADLANGTVSKWKDNMPRVTTLQKVAKYFDVTIDELLK